MTDIGLDEIKSREHVPPPPAKAQGVDWLVDSSDPKKIQLD
jgi:hypothetical protein